MTDPREVAPERQADIDALFRDLPTTYPDVEFQLEAIHTAVRSKIAEELQPHLNAFLQSKAKRASNLDECRQLTSLVDGTLSNLNLCAHINGEPALLVPERSGRDMDSPPQYAVIVRAENKQGFERKVVSKTLPPLELMAAPENVDAYIKPLRDYANAFMRNRQPGR
jgi:hypothetical protein